MQKAGTLSKQVQVKLVLLGEAGVGKSSLVLRYVRNDFQTGQEPTIGAAFLTTKCRVPEEPTRIIKFEIWDTAGQERFYSIAPMYYRGANAAVIVYDVTKGSSLDRARSWVQELQNQASPDIVIALAGNKSDLLMAAAMTATTTTKTATTAVSDGDNREQSYAEINANARRFASENGLLFYETSAKNGSNVAELFVDIARNLPQELLNAREQPFYASPPLSPKRSRSSIVSASAAAAAAAGNNNGPRLSGLRMRRSNENNNNSVPPSSCAC